MEEKPRQEKLNVEVRLATVEDLKAIKELRIFAATNSDDAFLLATTFEKETNKTNEQYLEEFFSKNRFNFLAENGSELIGMGTAVEGDGSNEKKWSVGNLYVKPNFRGDKVGLDILLTGLNLILHNKGENIIFWVRKKNKRMVSFAEKVGAKIVEETNFGLGYVMELDLTDPEVIKKINEVLNAK